MLHTIINYCTSSLVRIQCLCKMEMQDVSLVGSFRSTPFVEFQAKWRECLKHCIRLASSSSATATTMQYNHVEVIRILSNDINWKSLCEHHDEAMLRQKELRNGTVTAMEEIVATMMNPTCIPHCCQDKCLIGILLNAILVSPSSSSMKYSMLKRHKNSSAINSTMSATTRWTSSQTFLLNTVQKLLLFGSSSSSMSFARIRCIYEHVDYVTKSPASLLISRNRSTPKMSITVDTSAGMTPNEANRLLSTIYWLLCSSSFTSSIEMELQRKLLSCGLLLLQRIDDRDIQNNVHIPTEESGRSCCPNFDRSGGTKKKMKIAHLSDLHEKSDAFYRHSFNRQVHALQYKNASLKEVLSMNRKEKRVSNNNVKNAISTKKYNCLCANNSKNHDSDKILEKKRVADLNIGFSSDWSIVRSRAYKKFISFVVKQQQPLRREFSLSSPVKAYDKITEELMWWILRDAVTHPESPTLRVCLVLLSNSIDGLIYYAKIAKLCWRGYRQSPVLSCGWLRMYSEWLSECSVFDQRDEAWASFQPLFHHVLAILNKCTDRHIRQESIDTASEITPPVMACLGYILYRRSYLFESDAESIRNPNGNPSIAMQFRSFINLLSIHCGESSEWLSLYSHSENTRRGVEITLQRLGILGFLDSKQKSSRSNFSNAVVDNKYISIMCTTNWPYTSQFSMRNTMLRVDRSVLSLDRNKSITSLLTLPFNRLKRSGEKIITRKQKGKSLSSVPIMRYLHDGSVLHLIFSFCDHKQLIQLPQICKSWKVIVDMSSNTFWERAYIAEFGMYEVESRYLTIQSKGNTLNNEHQFFWRDHFMKKYIIERIIRFQRNPATGYKHRTCSFLGCLKIIKTAKQEQRHYQMHARRLSKQRSCLQRKNVKNIDKKED